MDLKGLTGKWNEVSLFEGLAPSSLLPPIAANPLKGHLSISTYTKGLINDLAHPAFIAEPHHTNLITRRRAARLQHLAPLLSMHQNEAALKWMTNLDYVRQRRRKAEWGKMPGNQRPPVMNNKSVCFKLQLEADNEINNELITMHLPALGDDLYVPRGVLSLLQHHGQA